MPRLRVLSFALALAACSSPMPAEPVCTPGEARACACSSGAMGAQVCSEDGARLGPCECSPLVDDAGLDVDGGVLVDDAGRAERDAGRFEEPDAGQPVEPDAGPELDAGPPPRCDLITQEGCVAPYQACRRRRGGPYSLPHSGEPDCFPIGTAPEWTSGTQCWGEDADGGRLDLCGRGLFCQSFNKCVRFCDPANEGQSCGVTERGNDTWCTCDGPGIDCYCTIVAP